MPNTRVFHRDQLDALGLPHDLATEDNAREFPEAAVELHREQVDTRRWVSVHELIFRAPDDGKAYRVFYERGLTENQDDTDPWGYAATVEATEVEQYEATVTAWRDVDEHQDEEQADPADVRDALAFNVAEPSPALATLRDVLLDTAPHTPHTAYATARILLAAHARELANRAEQHITDHRIAEPTGRSVRALRTGMGSIRRLITQQAERLDDQAQR
jgi:hypothetical protein